MPDWPSFFTGMSKPATSTNRVAQRYSAVTELATDTLTEINPSVLIPGKLAQLCLSLRSVLAADTHQHEKFLHGTQASICALQVGLSIYLFMAEGATCTDMESYLCRALMVSQLCYRGLLLTGWVSSEVMIDDPHAPKLE